MLTIQLIKEQTDLVLTGLKKKNFKDADSLIQSVIEIDTKRRETQREMDDANALANQNAKQIGVMMQQGQKDAAEGLKKSTADLKGRSKQLSDLLQNY
ncbi:MAG: serine--tRNA ligase, partial [Cytophagales bacterium]